MIRCKKRFPADICKHISTNNTLQVWRVIILNKWKAKWYVIVTIFLFSTLVLKRAVYDFYQMNATFKSGEGQCEVILLIYYQISVPH